VDEEANMAATVDVAIVASAARLDEHGGGTWIGSIFLFVEESVSAAHSRGRDGL